MSRYEQLREELRQAPRAWLVTGAAGFIGSHLVETLLSLGQRVVAMDNFATGHRRNVDQSGAAAEQGQFRFIDGDIRELEDCRRACEGVDIVLHQAALGSVPRSINDPLATHRANVDGFVNMLSSARDAGVGRFVFASSSSVYGDHPALPKVEENIGAPLSPYAVSKYVNELYAAVFQRTYGMHTVGLRYFNVFGRRQDPQGAYAAVIPRWVGQMLGGEPCVINGDGETSRDFCHVENVVQANLLAATAPAEATGQVYNVACGERTTLNQVHALLREGLAALRPGASFPPPQYGGFRPGDVRHSQADITRIRTGLGYVPTRTVANGLGEALAWYVASMEGAAPSRPPRPARP
jgi:UDP-N-acetylglucosamine 4-epimerase